MSTIKSANHQVGTSATPTNNFVLTADGLGSLIISRGTANEAPVTIMIINPDDSVSVKGDVKAFDI